MKMYLISDNIDTLTGMRLAGVDGIVVHEREELRTAIEDAMNDKDGRNHPADGEIRAGVPGSD